MKKHVKKTRLLLLILAIIFIGPVLVIMFIGVTTRFFFPPQKSLIEEKVVIALVGPMSGPDKIYGEAMLKGINLYLDEIKGKHSRRNIELLVLNDHNNEQTAAQVAADIARENKALIVIGHYGNPASIAAGNIYKKAEIPAITASATDGRVTIGNDWYFSIFPTNHYQITFAAHYIKNFFKKNSVSIILDKENYNTSLVDHFERITRSRGIEMKKKWIFDSRKANLDKTSNPAISGFWEEMELNRIIAEIKATDDPGALFFATHAREGAKIIKSIKEPGMGYAIEYAIIGLEPFLSDSFIEEFQQYPWEQKNPGYYSNGVYVISPALGAINNEEAFVFMMRMQHEDGDNETYQEDVLWTAASYYDAMQVAVRAIEKAHIQGAGHIYSDRRKVRAALASFYAPEKAINGVTGDLYFNPNGNSRRDIAVVVYEQQKLFRSFLQYQIPSDPGKIENPFKEALSGNLILVDGQIMTKFRVVYTGIAINEIIHFDEQNSTCTIDFYLWFRFQGDFKDTDIKFSNVVTPVSLGQPVMEEIRNNITTRVYRVKADIKGDLTSPAYLADYDAMSVKFRHASQTRDQLVYFVDELGLPQSLKTKNGNEPLSLPNIKGFNLYETSSSTISTLGIYYSDESYPPISYSQISAQFLLKRKESSGIFRRLAPIIGVVLMVYLVYFLPPARCGRRVVICILALFANAFFHFRLASIPRIEYFITIEYAFFIVYAFIVIALFTSTLPYIFNKRGARKVARIFTWVGRIMYPFLVVASFISWIVYMVSTYFVDKSLLAEIARYFTAMN